MGRQQRLPTAFFLQKEFPGRQFRKSLDSGQLNMGDIDHWRKRIDEINLELLELLNERSQCAIEIGKIKQRLNLEVYDPQREQRIIQSVQTLTRGPLTKEAIRRLFERIIDESRRAERESNNHEAAKRQAKRSERSEE